MANAPKNVAAGISNGRGGSEQVRPRLVAPQDVAGGCVLNTTIAWNQAMLRPETWQEG